MHVRRGWPVQTITENSYRRSFVDAPGDFAREFLYWNGGKLVGVALADVLPHCLSSVTFFHDPAHRRNAPGVFSVLRQLQFAREHAIQQQYLGYWIAECGSMAYKSQYRPHEILERYVDDDEAPMWIRVNAKQPGAEHLRRNA
jgi:arginine-tRNA-protein transferase